MKLKNLTKYLFVVLLLFNIAATSHSQNITVKGMVKDGYSGEGLPGVNIVEEGTTNGTISDANGNYSITVTGSESILEFSYVGYLTEKIQVANQTAINLVLLEDIAKLDEVVVVGYGTQKKSDITGSVTVVNTENMDKLVGSDISQLLQGQAAGVQVFGSGEPGAIPRVQIRGVGTFGNTNPLYVIDGVPVGNQLNIGGGTYSSNVPVGGIADFNPSDVESIQILKDASAAAIYGSRGANGVIIITTKKGQKGATRITYEGNYGVQNVVKRMDLTNRVQFQEMHNLSRTNDNLLRARANNPERPEFIDSIDTDWQEEVFTQGHITDHILSVNGGSDNANYYASVNYFDQTGTMVGPGPRYTRYSAHLNMNQEKGRFRFGQSFHYSFSDQIRLTNTQWANPIYETVLGLPTVPVYDSSNIGGYGGGALIYDQIAGNQVAFNNLKSMSFNRHRFFGVIYGELEILKSLRYKLNLSYDRSEWFNKEFQPVFEVGTRHVNPIAFLNEWRGENPYLLMEHTLTFNKLIGKHDFTLLGGYSAQKDWFEDVYAHAQGYTEPYIEVISAGSEQTSLGTRSEHTMISYLGRLIYSYADRYLATVSFRRDLSSRFGPNNKVGLFPSFSLGWKISSEPFFNLDYFTLLKLRGGYGAIGNENIGDYLYETYVNNAASYVFGGVLVPGSTQTNAVDPSISWEERITSNIGIDAALFKNKIEFSAEYYHNEANKILLGFPIPISTGDVGWQVTSNGASMTNQGIELNLSYRKYEGKLHYEFGGNLTTLKNKVTKIGPDNTPVTTFFSKTEVGRSMGEIYGWVFDGIFQNQEEISQHAFQSAYTRPGDVRFKDINGRDAQGNLTGQPDGVINDDDRTYLGVVFPKVTGGLNLGMDYKGFDFSLFVQGVFGNKAYNGVYQLINAMTEGNYSVESYENYWRGEGTSQSWPRPSRTDANGNNRVTERWIQDASYVRIQNIELGYSVPVKLLTRIRGVSSFRIYIASQNFLTLTGYTGYDPDFVNDGIFNRGLDGGSYPSPRTFRLGVKLML